MVESEKIQSPISVLFFSYYSNLEDISFNKHDIQCVVSNVYTKLKTTPFGDSQLPELFDYADEIDTISFLLSKS